MWVERDGEEWLVTSMIRIKRTNEGKSILQQFYTRQSAIQTQEGAVATISKWFDVQCIEEKDMIKESEPQTSESPLKAVPSPATNDPAKDCS
jgi:hypothetical protein